MDSLRQHKGKVLGSIVLAMVGVGFGVIPYYALATIISKLVAGDFLVKAYIPYIILILLGFMGQVVFHAMSTIMSHRLAYGVIADKRSLLTDKLHKISMGQVEAKSSGQWAQFMVETLDKLEQPIAHVIPEVLANFLIPLVMLGLIFSLDWRLGIANLISLPLGLAFAGLMMRGYEQKSRRYQSAAKAMNTAMVEYVHGIKLIKAFNQSASSYQKFKETVEENKNAMLEWYLSVCFSMTASQELIPASLVFVLPAGLYLLMQGKIDVAVLVMVILLSYASYRPLIKAMGHMDTMANIKVILDEINQIMDLPELERAEEYQKIDNYQLEFKNVSFSYQEDKQVLDRVSFVAKEKQLTAIVGDSGGGKSTIAKLIAGFWNVSEGQITIGGVSLKQMPLKQNMELVTYVSQDNFMFNRSILDNLRLAKETASMEEIEAACRRASCHDFIMSLPDGYQSMVGEGGTKLSGGELQRLTIARALLKDSPIVVLDEATAYADPDNEAVIQESISSLLQDRTVIMIAHRLSTIAKAEQILVIDQGRLIESGNHESLMEQGGKYSQMWRTYAESKQIEVI